MQQNDCIKGASIYFYHVDSLPATEMELGDHCHNDCKTKGLSIAASCNVVFPSLMKGKQKLICSTPLKFSLQIIPKGKSRYLDSFPQICISPNIPSKMHGYGITFYEKQWESETNYFKLEPI